MKQRVITAFALLVGVVFFLGFAGVPLLLMCALITFIACHTIDYSVDG